MTSNPNYFLDVLQFSVATESHIGGKPSIPPMRITELRLDLIWEEMEELEAAAYVDDLEGIADACADLIYVVIGTAIAYGIDLNKVWEEVHRANMAKLTGPKRADGKQLKPEGWQPPDIRGVLQAQGMEVEDV